MKINVFVIPHAGGTASTYYKLKEYKPDIFQFHFVELSGRGRRSREKLYSTFEEAVDDIFNQIKNEICEGPYILFGHSMGSWLTYELYYRILSEGMSPPIYIFFSGNRSPFTKPDDVSVINMDDQTFSEYIMKNHEAPQKIFKVKKLREIFLPILRSDYEMMERYNPETGREKISVDISILGGETDPLLSEGFYDWKKLTQGHCNSVKFQGKHFYIFEKMKEVTDYMAVMIHKYIDR